MGGRSVEDAGARELGDVGAGSAGYLVLISLLGRLPSSTVRPPVHEKDK